MPARQQEVWELRLGHKNFQNSNVDNGGDLSKLCEDELTQIAATTEGGYLQIKETQVMTEKPSFDKSEEKKANLFQNYPSELEEEEKQNEMFFQQQYLDLDKLIQKTFKIPSKQNIKSSNITVGS